MTIKRPIETVVARSTLRVAMQTIGQDVEGLTVAGMLERERASVLRQAEKRGYPNHALSTRSHRVLDVTSPWVEYETVAVVRENAE